MGRKNSIGHCRFELLRLLPALAGLLLLAVALISPAIASADNLPTLANEQASEVGVTTAKMTGTVNPNGEAGAGPTTWRLQFTPTTEEAWTTAAETTIEAPASEAANPVAVEAIPGFGGELQPGATYEFRLQAENGAGQAETTQPYPSFTMDEATAPVLLADPATDVAYTTATLHGQIDPKGGNVNPIGGPLPIYWQLEYREAGTEGWSYGGSGEPIEGAAAESTEPIEVQAELANATLQPAHGYETRLLAYYLNFTREAQSAPGPAFETDAVAPPTITIDPAASITGTGAHFSGTVTANGTDPAFDSSCGFDYVTDAQFQAAVEGGFAQAQQISCDLETLSGEAPTSVQADATGLQPNITYHLRLRASNAGGEETATAAPFTTAAVKPVIAMPAGAGLSETTAHLTAWVNPKSAVLTDCTFEWGPADGDYSLGSASCDPDPGNAGVATQTGADLSGLQAETTYHFRVRATNSAGEEASDDAQFTTVGPLVEPECPDQPESGPSSRLPDCRVYEQVSPVDKRGADVLPSSRRVRVAADGRAVQFASLAYLDDTQGGGVATEHLSLRDPSTGIWSSHGITPRQQASSIVDAIGWAFEPRYMGEFSADLNSGVFMAKSPLTDDPNVGNGTVNLYLRDDLRQPGEGHYHLITIADTPQSGTSGLKPWLVDTTADFSHIVFESERNLTPDASGLPGPSSSCIQLGFGCYGRSKLYEWVNGNLRLAGILPNGEPTLSQASQGAAAPHRSYTPDTLSRDGARVVFTAPPYDSNQRGGALYIRDDHGTAESDDDTTTQINTSEMAEPVESQPAAFQAASADASVIYFSSSEQLTDTAPPSGGLYRFDLNAPEGERLNLISVDSEPADGTSSSIAGVVGASEDGSYVYFIVDQNQLVAGGPVTAAGPGGVHARIFVWHSGALREVGGIQNIDFNESVGSLGWSGRPKSSRVTPDGEHMVFVTHGTPELLSLFGAPAFDHGHCDQVGCKEIYVFDANANGGSGDLHCASCNLAGDGATADADFVLNNPDGLGGVADSSHLGHILSDDGRFVFFSTEERLLEEDTNATVDAYEYDGVTHQVYLISSGTDSSPSMFLDASADGSDAFFTTRKRLRSSDVDESRDLYDVRIGGVPDSPITPPAPCEPLAGQCQESSEGSPEAASPASAAFTGAADPRPRYRKHRKKHKHRRRHHRLHRATHTDRRPAK